MFSIKNLIFQILILMVIAALTNCSPSKPISGGVSRRTEPAINDTTPVFGDSTNISILDKTQFEASGMTLLTSDPDSNTHTGESFVACETTVASPWIWNIRKVADYLNNFNGWYCCNWNVSGGGCSLVMTIEDASTALCGNQGCIRCEEMRDNLNKIVDFCKRDNKAGGVAFLDQGIHIVVY